MAKNSKEALRILDRLFRIAPEKARPEWKEAMVQALIAEGRGKRALSLLEELVSESRGEKKRQWGQILLYQYLDLGMDKKARNLAFGLARNYPGDERWWKAIVHCALKQGNVEEAIMALTIISFIRPLDRHEARLMADMNLQANIPQKALPVYEELLASDPSPELLKRVIYACMEMGMEDRVLELLDRYEKAASRDFSLAMILGDILYSRSRYRDALSAYIQAIKIKRSGKRQVKGNERGRAWLMAGYCFWQMDKPEKALSALAEAARFPASRTRALEARSYIRKVTGGGRPDEKASPKIQPLEERDKTA